MTKQLLDKFIEYTKEQFGCDIQLKESSTPDTFKKIIGASFLENDES